MRVELCRVVSANGEEGGGGPDDDEDGDGNSVENGRGPTMKGKSLASVGG